MNNQFTLPIKNLHGTNMESLQNDYIKGMNLLDDAIKHIAYKIEFNARDYSDSLEYLKAKKERLEMLQKLNDVYLYLEEIASSI